MMTEDFCNQQAESCERAAEAALLDNQRNTLLRSREAWLAMAARERSIRDARAKREAEKETEQ